jgi:hypothetical protein
MPSGSFPLTDNSAFVVCYLDWFTSDDPANNQSTLTVVFNAYTTGTQNTFGTFSGGITIDGLRYAISGQRTVVTGGSTVVTEIGRASRLITHSSDGTRSVAVSADGGIPGTSWTTTSGGGTAPLTDYNRSPVFTTANAPTPVIRGVSYSGQFTATNTSSYTRTGTLPPGLTFNTSNGALTGTPTTVGSYGFTITANGAFEGSASVSRTVVVNPALPVFSDATVEPTANVGIAYSDGVTASEAASYSVFSGALPNGLSLNTSTGAITGTPTTPGTFTFVIRATNVTGSTNTGTLTITAISAARVWNGTAFVSGLANVWNGTAFVSGIIKVWDGTTWKNTN